MTMGDRVAVIRKGVLQQVDAPQYLYDHPSNLFVAGFIGSPAMNMVEATLARSDRGSTIEFGGYRLAVPDDVLASRPDLKGYEGKQVIVGIRPEDMEDAEMEPDAPADHRVTSSVFLREALGADVLVHFMIKAPAVLTEDSKELADDVGAEAVEAVERGAMAGESEFLARLNPRTNVRKGEPLELVVDVHRMHFFDPESGQGIYGGDREPDGSRSS
jgi:multiple sugar transport system ATP-binding protein